MGYQEHKIVIPGGKRGPSSLMVHYLINLLVGSGWAIFAYKNFQHALGLPEFNWQAFLYLSLFFRNSSITVLFLIRRPTRESSKSIKEWLWALLGTFLGFFYVPEKAYSLIPPDHHGIVFFVLIFAIGLSLLAVLSLGRSFGIVPANRGIQTGGLYSIVRHPIYACYIFFDGIFLSIRFSGFNLSIFCASSLALYLRAIYEERFLRQDAAYRQYAEKTRYMFFPGFI